MSSMSYKLLLKNKYANKLQWLLYVNGVIKFLTVIMEHKEKAEIITPEHQRRYGAYQKNGLT